MAKTAFKKSNFLLTSKLDLSDETNEILHLEHNFVWSWILDTL